MVSALPVRSRGPAASLGDLNEYSSRLISRRTREYDIKQSNASWAKWLNEGPCKGLGRHHKLTRVASGWIPSAISDLGDVSSSTDELEADRGEDNVSQASLERAQGQIYCPLGGRSARCESGSPLSQQGEVDVEAQRWSKEWACQASLDELKWPAESLISNQAPLPNLTIMMMVKAAHTFSAGTGLGWDKLHPRAVCRCSDEAILALIRIFILCELIGEWPATIGIILISRCLL